MKRRNYAATDENIKNMYMDIIKAEKRMPTQTEVAERCHLARQTVNEHLNNINLDELTPPFKVFGNHVLMGLANKARKGDAQAAKLFFMLVYDWNEKHVHEIEDPIEINIKVHYEDEDKSKNK